MIEDGRLVSIEYTLKLDNGKTADTNVEAEPLVYRQGESQILTALEKSLAGLAVGDTKQVTLSPEEGYGPMDPAAFETVGADLIPEDARHAGAQLVAQSPDGDRRLVRVHEMRGEEIVLDLNHPLAGETLHFDVRILTIE